MGCYSRTLRSLAQHHRRFVYRELDLAAISDSSAKAMSRRFCPLRAVLLSTFMAVHHVVHRPSAGRRAPHRFLPRSLLRAHPVFISCFAMDQNEPVVSDDDDESWATASEGGTTTSEDSEADLLTKIEDARKDLASCPPDHPDRAECAAWVGYYLYTSYSQSGDISMIDGAIEAEREALALRPPGHPDRLRSCVNLANSLYARYQQTGTDVALLDEATELNREALSLRPPGHPSRANSCDSLATSLRSRYEQTGDVALLDEAIELKRQALSLRPLGHPDRSTSCNNLAVTLSVRYDQTGDAALLDEAIELDREALALRPPGHPDRSNTCYNLAGLLHTRYEKTGDVMLLDEEIGLNREALSLRPPGHPARANSCSNLAVSLGVRYELTSDVALLDEAIKLKREALSLQPLSHPDRATSCSNLALSLHTRYKKTGDVALLDEAIELEREGLSLRPPGHFNRADTCSNLAGLLHTRYEQPGNVALLDEEIGLNREALSLRPPGHPDRAISCSNLAASLHERYEQTGNVALLDEEIGLDREALSLRPPGHPDRAISCVGLESSLRVRYKLTGDVALLDEAIETCILATKCFSASQVWHSWTRLSRLRLLRNSPHYSVLQALVYLQQSFQHEVDDTYRFISEVCPIAALIWDDAGVWSSHSTALFVDVYAKIVDQLPLVAGFVLDTSSRLKTLKSTRQVGSDACVAALLAEQPATAVSLLDRAHGIVWAQALHQRDPQMEGAPKDLAIELENLLRSIATSAPVDRIRLPEHTRDLRHRQNARIQVILREIRAMPGLERFMLGSTYETLRKAARDHPVVMLVAARHHTFAVIIPNASHTDPDILRLNVANDTLQSFANSVGRANMRYRECSPSCEDVPLADSIGLGPDRKMGPGDHLTYRSPLAKLWLSAVKPVLAHLGLAVRPPRRRKSTHH
jgi:tetratricopeptide (TPR) repeat protein